MNNRRVRTDTERLEFIIGFLSGKMDLGLSRESLDYAMDNADRITDSALREVKGMMIEKIERTI